MPPLTNEQYAECIRKIFPKGMHCPFCGCTRWGIGTDVVLKGYYGEFYAAKYLFCAHCGFVNLRDAGIVEGCRAAEISNPEPLSVMNRHAEVTEFSLTPSNRERSRGFQVFARFRLYLRALAGRLLDWLSRP